MYQQIWKDVPTWNGVFQVSNFGRVYNTITKHFIKGFKNKNGYWYVDLKWKGRLKRYQFSRLVCEVWKRPFVENQQAHHKIKQLKCCNCIWNLEIKDGTEHLEEHMKGKVWTQEQIDKRVETKKKNGFKHTQQTKRKIGNANRGRKLSPETIAKRVETRKQKRCINT